MSRSSEDNDTTRKKARQPHSPRRAAIDRSALSESRTLSATRQQSSDPRSRLPKPFLSVEIYWKIGGNSADRADRRLFPRFVITDDAASGRGALGQRGSSE